MSAGDTYSVRNHRCAITPFEVVPGAASQTIQSMNVRGSYDWRKTFPSYSRALTDQDAAPAVKGPTTLNDSLTNTLLGYPDDARLLIINADDFGMCHSVVEAILRGLKEGVVTSTTLMTTCPWAPYAIQLLHENPDISFGVHLTLV